MGGWVGWLVGGLKGEYIKRLQTVCVVSGTESQ